MNANIAAPLLPLAIPITDCHPDPTNARTGHAIDRIAASLRQYGQRKPIVVNSSEGGKIEAGNGTWEAARSLGWTHIAAVTVEDDPMTAVGYGISDNRTGHLSEWDAEILAILAESLPPETYTGFEGDELEELLAGLGAGLDASTGNGQGDAEPQVDRAEELRQVWGTETGQLWQIGEHRLIVGDCTDRAVVERVMGGERAALAPVDPPYNVGFDYDRQTVDDNKAGEKYEAFSRAWFGECQGVSERQIVTPGCNNLALWLRWFDAYHWAPWTKTNSMTNGKVSRFWCWEPVLFFGERWTRRRPNDVFDYPISNQQGVANHPCPKPLKMWTDLIENYSEPGAVIYESFAGSGTTLVACQNLNRRARAIEISPAYCAVILQRMADAFPGIDIRQVET